jgi:MoaA/NifB/PqqE/SkfB family radical SAM enzyme
MSQMTDRYQMGGHKLLWHSDRVAAWMKGERIAPLHIDVGLSKGCNIRCQYCFGMMQGNRYMAGIDTFFPREPLLRYVRDAGAIGVRSMAFIGEAEPLVNPHVYDAIATAREAGVDVALGTNGVLFDTGRDGTRALENLSWIRFNLSAASDEAYLRIHGSDQFSALLERVRFVVETKARLRLPVTVGLQMVLTPQNVDQAVPLAHLGGELGVDYVVIKQCSDSQDNALGVYQRLGEYRSFTELLKAAEAEGRDDFQVIVKWGHVTNEGYRGYEQCLGVPFLVYSSGDGKLFPCGMFFQDRAEEFCMGDLVKESFRKIWESDRYWDVVRRVAETIDVSKCYSNCRTNCINEYVWMLRHPPEHVNFI